MVLHVGRDFPRPPGLGRLVDSWSSARIIMEWADLTGLYVFHGHNLEHEDHAMMSQFQAIA